MKICYTNNNLQNRIMISLIKFIQVIIKINNKNNYSIMIIKQKMETNLIRMPNLNNLNNNNNSNFQKKATKIIILKKINNKNKIPLTT